MARPSRRNAQQPAPQYAVVPQSPSRSASYLQPHPVGYVGGPRPRSTSARSHRRNSEERQQHGRQEIAMGVASGHIGTGYGPYSYHPQQAVESGVYNNNGRFSKTRSERSAKSSRVAPARAKPTMTVPHYIWGGEPEPDDALHNPDPHGDWVFRPFSLRGWMNIGGISILVLGLLVLFIGYPVLIVVTRPKPHISGWNVGGINGSGQIPEFTKFPLMIDNDTPQSALTRVGSDGKTYDLVFSDEFNIDGRTFYPGEDPYWEAADLYYWPTGDSEWYDPSAITTQDGKLVITISEQSVHNLDFMSGMLTSWNKLCFMTGYIEVSVSLPGAPKVPGLWPGVWTLGNLGRAGYGATTEGMWPYSYDSCDLGTFPGQQTKDGLPTASSTGGTGGGVLSSLPGQKLSACTCPGSDHPGPSVSVGRGVPEIDIIEAQIDLVEMQGTASQSFQIAPYNMGYDFDETAPASVVYNSTMTHFNTYKGGPLQQALSSLTYYDDQYYGGQSYMTVGYEWWSDPNHRSDGYITWFYNGQKTWTVTAAAIGADSQSEVSARLIPEEPMYVILNLGMSTSFQGPDLKNLQFPARMYIDYVRIYQRRGIKNGITCDPPTRPTADYISRHTAAYTNANLTTWSQANETFPRNSMYDGCT